VWKKYHKTACTIWSSWEWTLGWSKHVEDYRINPLNSQLNPIRHWVALLGTHPIVHVSRIRVTVSAEYRNSRKSTAARLNKDLNAYQLCTAIQTWSVGPEELSWLLFRMFGCALWFQYRYRNTKWGFTVHPKIPHFTEIRSDLRDGKQASK